MTTTTYYYNRQSILNLALTIDFDLNLTYIEFRPIAGELGSVNTETEVKRLVVFIIRQSTKIRRVLTFLVSQ